MFGVKLDPVLQCLQFVFRGVSFPGVQLSADPVRCRDRTQSWSCWFCIHANRFECLMEELLMILSLLMFWAAEISFSICGFKFMFLVLLPCFGSAVGQSAGLQTLFFLFAEWTSCCCWAALGLVQTCMKERVSLFQPWENEISHYSFRRFYIYMLLCWSVDLLPVSRFKFVFLPACCLTGWTVLLLWTFIRRFCL